MTRFVAPLVEGTRVRVRPATADDLEELQDLDWHRSLVPAMAGWTSRGAIHAGPGTAVACLPAADGDTGETIVGTVDVSELPGYPGVANVSIYTDTARAPGGLAMEAYGLVVEEVFAQGAHLVHHEVLSLNRPVLRILRAVGVESSARYRDHAYVAGRWWDVHVFAFAAEQWRAVLDRLPRNPVVARRDDGGKDPVHDG